MRASIKDADVLGAVTPVQIIAYLRAHGWKRGDDNAGLSVYWIGGSEDEYELLVPSSRALSGYVRRIADILRLVSDSEDRSELDVYRDIVTSTVDIIRIRAIDSSFNDGTIPIEGGVALVERARDLLLAAASSAYDPRPVFYSRKPSAAVDYMRHARLGQTEHGSFVVTIHAPVPPELQSTFEGMPSEEPFERAVTSTLARATAAAQAAVVRAASDGAVAAFEDAVRVGVSANLCDALVGFHEIADVDAVSVTTSWAAVRPVSADLARIPPATIRRDALPLLREASRVFRWKNPERAREVAGYVVRLQQRPNHLGNVSIVEATSSRRQIQIRDLASPEYDIFIRAHAEMKRVRVVGDVAKEGRGWALKNPRDIQVVADEEDLSGEGEP